MWRAGRLADRRGEPGVSKPRAKKRKHGSKPTGKKAQVVSGGSCTVTAQVTVSYLIAGPAATTTTTTTTTTTSASITATATPLVNTSATH